MSICKVAAICLHLLLCVCVLCHAAEPGLPSQTVTPGDPDRFIGIVTAIMQDPNSGAWMQIYVTFYYVMVWYRNGAELPTLGAKIRILAIYVDSFGYPSGDVSIYKGLSWEAVYGQDR